MIKTRTWILLFALLLAAACAACAWLALRKTDGTAANIYVDGTLWRSIDLAAVTEPYTFVIETPRGTNTVAVEPGRIRILAADCPDLVCVHEGWRSDSPAPIVCLPHRVVVRIERESAFDAVTQ